MTSIRITIIILAIVLAVGVGTEAALEDVIDVPMGEIERACVGRTLAEFWKNFETGKRPKPKKLEKAARAGDLESQLMFGLYQMFTSEELDFRGKGSEWMRMAADANYAPAQFHLGMLHLMDKRRKNQAKGEELMANAADQGIILARIYLGHFYSDLPGSRPDTVKAEQWYLSAAEEGCVSVRWTIGLLYAERNGGPSDDIRAYMWFILHLEDIPQSEQIGVDVDMREVERRLNPQEIAEAKRLASEWKSTH